MRISKFLLGLGLWIVLGGCGKKVVQVEKKSQLPAFFIEFEAGKSELNNSYALKAEINKVKSGYRGKSVFVLVVSGNSLKEHNLAVARMFAIAKAIEGESIRVVVKELERPEQANRMAVYHAKNWDEIVKEDMTSAEFSSFDGADGVFRTSDKRLFLVEPEKKTMTLEGNGQVEQLEEALLQLGWTLDSSDVELSNEEVLSIASVEVITLGAKATKDEIQLFVSGFLEAAFPDHDFAVDSNKREIRVWKMRVGGEES